MSLLAKTIHSLRGAFAKNMIWSLAGTGVPLIAALVSVPPLIHAVGAARFGMLSLAWVIVGYFGLFDLGLGRALTQLVAIRHGARGEEMGRTIWSALALMTALGIVSAALLASTAPLIVRSYLAIPDALKGETTYAMVLLAATVPMVIVTTGLRGILEGYQRFDVVNVLRIPMGMMAYVGPLLALPFTHRLPGLVSVLVLVRLVGCIAHIWACTAILPELRHPRMGSLVELQRIAAFGGWLTVSNIAAPLLLYLGRIALAVLVSAEAVAYFATPYDMIINLLIVPTVLSNVLYPSFASLTLRDAAEADRLFRQARAAIAAVMAPSCLVAATIAYPALALWIGPAFADHGYHVWQLLALGVFINSFGHLCQAVIQGSGHPDWTAKLHLFELAIYVPYMYFLIKHFGVIGAAVAWVVRVTISTVILLYLTRRCLDQRANGGGKLSRAAA